MNADYGIGALNASIPAFRVTGIQKSGDRAWSATITGDWAGTISVERSYDDQFSGFEVYQPMVLSDNTYVTGSPVTLTSNGTLSINDADDNAITWYRLTFTSYTSGSAQININYGGYGLTGVARVIIAGGNTAEAVVISEFANTTPSNVWLEGEWNEVRGFPTAVSLFDGRLWWARDDQFWGSVSDNYYSMATSIPATATTSGTTITGDSSSIQRMIATGGSFDDVVYMLPLQRLVFGTSGAEVSARSSSLDEPLTPTNITLKDCSSQGGAPAMAAKIDKRGIYIQRSTHKLYALVYDVYQQDYNSENLMRINEDIGYPQNPAYTQGFLNLAVQRQPETYVWAIRSDGICCCLLYEPLEKVQGWFRVTTGQGEFAYQVTEPDGSPGPGDQIVSVAVLPNEGEDIVYFVVQRYVGTPGPTYYVEKMQSHYNTLTRAWDPVNLVQTTAPGLFQADCYSVVTPTGIGNLNVSGMGHLEGREVVALGYSIKRQSYGPLLNPDGSPYYTVYEGQITLGEPPTGDVTVGIPYKGYYKSSKLAYGAPQGSTALLQPKKVDNVGLLLQDTHPDALLIGSDFNGIESMDPLPRLEDLQPVQTTGTLARVYDKRMFPIANVWDTDARVCVEVQPGYSATLSGIVLAVETNPSG